MRCSRSLLPIWPQRLCRAVLPLEPAHSLSAGSLLAVLLAWQRLALREQELPLGVQRAEQDHKSPHLRGRQLEQAPDVHHKILAEAQTVLVLPGLAQRVAHPPAQVTRQTHHLSVQVMAARLHPFGVKTQVKTRQFPAKTARHTPKGVKSYHPVRSEHLKLPRHLLHLNGRQVPIKAPLRSNPPQALRLKHPNQGPLAQLQALSRALARPAITAFRPILHKPMPEDPRH